jgi:peptidoglycan/xylan/chitin deacetylase (PgdA/CDA1 family)/GT2 family glycosyltransferase
VAGGIRISVVIPTHQRRSLVVEALEALALQDLEAPWEVVVVVDGSTDGTAEALRRHRAPVPLTVLEQERAGAAAARNRGARATEGELLLFLDDDMVADPSLLSEHDRAHRAGADAVVGHIPLHPGSAPTVVAEGVGRWAEERGERLAAAPIITEVGEILTGQLSVDRRLFESLGGFDEGFTGGGRFGDEDVDLGWRLLAGRHRVVFTPGAISHQRYVVDAATNLRQHREWGAADVALTRKHPALVERTFGPGRERSHVDRVLEPLALRMPRAVPRLLGSLEPAVVRRVEGGRRDRGTRRAFGVLQRGAYWSGVAGAGGPPTGDRVRVLCWHAVSDLTDDPVLAPYGVPGRELAAQLDLLGATGHACVSPDEVCRLLDGAGGVPRRSVLVTFDDCYADLLDEGAPRLAERSVPAVAFAISAAAGAENDWDQRIGARPMPLLDARGLRALPARGIEVGSHGRTHRELPLVPREDLRTELDGSAAELAGLGLPRPRFVAYPYGEHDDATREAARAAGYRGAFTVEPGVVGPRSDRYRLPRIEVLAGDTGWRLRWKLATAGRTTSIGARVRSRVRRLVPARVRTAGGPPAPRR